MGIFSSGVEDNFGYQLEPRPQVFLHQVFPRKGCIKGQLL